MDQMDRYTYLLMRALKLCEEIVICLNRSKITSNQYSEISRSLLIIFDISKNIFQNGERGEYYNLSVFETNIVYAEDQLTRMKISHEEVINVN